MTLPTGIDVQHSRPAASYLQKQYPFVSLRFELLCKKAVLFFLAMILGVEASASDGPWGRCLTSKGGDVQVDSRGVTGRLENATLEQILDTLRKAEVLEYKAPTHVLSSPISRSFCEQPVEEILRDVLHQFDYYMWRQSSDQAYKVVILGVKQNEALGPGDLRLPVEGKTGPPPEVTSLLDVRRGNKKAGTAYVPVGLDAYAHGNANTEFDSPPQPLIELLQRISGAVPKSRE